MYVLVIRKYKIDRMKNNQEKVATPFSPIITLWELSVAMKTMVRPAACGNIAIFMINVILLISI